MKHTLVLFWVIFLFVSCNNKNTREKAPAYVMKRMSDEASNYKFNASYPVFNNEFVDNKISTRINQLKSDFESEIGEVQISENWKNEQGINVQVFYSSQGYISTLFYNYLFTGGAHGNTMLKSLVLDTEMKTELELGDVMKGSYFEKLQDLTREQLKEKLGYEGFVDEGTETVADFSVFVLSNDSISFYFPQYQVASYADGIQKVSFSIDTFQKSSALE